MTIRKLAIALYVFVIILVFLLECHASGLFEFTVDKLMRSWGFLN